MVIRDVSIEVMSQPISSSASEGIEVFVEVSKVKLEVYELKFSSIPLAVAVLPLLRVQSMISLISKEPTARSRGDVNLDLVKVYCGKVQFTCSLKSLGKCIDLIQSNQSSKSTRNSTASTTSLATRRKLIHFEGFEFRLLDCIPDANLTIIQQSICAEMINSRENDLVNFQSYEAAVLLDSQSVFGIKSMETKYLRSGDMRPGFVAVKVHGPRFTFCHALVMAIMSLKTLALKVKRDATFEPLQDEEGSSICTQLSIGVEVTNARAELCIDSAVFIANLSKLSLMRMSSKKLGKFLGLCFEAGSLQHKEYEFLTISKMDFFQCESYLHNQRFVCSEGCRLSIPPKLFQGILACCEYGITKLVPLFRPLSNQMLRIGSPTRMEDEKSHILSSSSSFDHVFLRDVSISVESSSYGIIVVTINWLKQQMS